MSNYIYQDLGGWTDAVKSIGTSVFETIQSYGAQKGKAELSEELLKAQMAAAAGRPAAAAKMPSWLLPVGIGAAALVLILVLKKK